MDAISAGFNEKFLTAPMWKILGIKDKKKRVEAIIKHYDDQTLRFEMDRIEKNNPECILLLLKSCNIVNKIDSFRNKAKADFNELKEECPGAYNLLNIFYLHDITNRINRVWHLCAKRLKENKRLSQAEIEEMEEPFEVESQQEEIPEETTEEKKLIIPSIRCPHCGAVFTKNYPIPQMGDTNLNLNCKKCKQGFNVYIHFANGNFETIIS